MFVYSSICVTEIIELLSFFFVFACVNCLSVRFFFSLAGFYAMAELLVGSEIHGFHTLKGTDTELWCFKTPRFLLNDCGNEVFLWEKLPSIFCLNWLMWIGSDVDNFGLKTKINIPDVLKNYSRAREVLWISI